MLFTFWDHFDLYRDKEIFFKSMWHHESEDNLIFNLSKLSFACGCNSNRALLLHSQPQTRKLYCVGWVAWWNWNEQVTQCPSFNDFCPNIERFKNAKHISEKSTVHAVFTDHHLCAFYLLNYCWSSRRSQMVSRNS